MLQYIDIYLRCGDLQKHLLFGILFLQKEAVGWGEVREKGFVYLGTRLLI